MLPAGEARHSEEILSDQPEREFFAEMIREQIFHSLHQELPYSVAVVIDEVEEQMEPHRYRIRATLFVERDSQKGIIIGAGGSGLRRIGFRSCWKRWSYGRPQICAALSPPACPPIPSATTRSSVSRP